MEDFISRFEYDFEFLPEPRVVVEREEEDIITRLMVVSMPDGSLRMAEVIRPNRKGFFAAALFVHWYEPKAADSNRTQFREEARTLARQGTVCLLVETLWSDSDWFLKRTQDDDEHNSIDQVIMLSVFADLLLLEPGVDPSRFVYIGHDFGAMYGVLWGAVDGRAHAYALMAGTPRFGDWYLYYPRLEGQDREDYLEQMREYDPIEHVGILAPAPILMQFAETDEHVSKERAEAFFAAAGEPKKIGWYGGGHALDETARMERLAWLAEQLGLKS